MSKATYGNHPHGTKSKRDIHTGKARMRWQDRLNDGQEHGITVSKMDPVDVALSRIDAHSTAARRRRVYLGV